MKIAFSWKKIIRSRLHLQGLLVVSPLLFSFSSALASLDLPWVLSLYPNVKISQAALANTEKSSEANISPSCRCRALIAMVLFNEFMQENLGNDRRWTWVRDIHSRWSLTASQGKRLSSFSQTNGHTNSLFFCITANRVSQASQRVNDGWVKTT